MSDVIRKWKQIGIGHKVGGAIWVLAGGTWASLFAAQLMPQMDINKFLFITVGIVVLAIIYHCVLFWFSTRKTAYASSSYNELVPGLPDKLHRLIENAYHIDILGGMLTEFVRQPDVLEALKQAHSRKAKLRILMLDPASNTVRAVARDREYLRGASLGQHLESECLDSMSRLASALTWDGVKESVRLYSSLPHSAVHRFDDHYMVTAYTFGRGGSSPALYVRREPNLKAYCDGLDRGFQELWVNEKATRPLTSELYESLRRDIVVLSLPRIVSGP